MEYEKEICECLWEPSFESSRSGTSRTTNQWRENDPSIRHDLFYYYFNEFLNIYIYLFDYYYIFLFYFIHLFYHFHAFHLSILYLTSIHIFSFIHNYSQPGNFRSKLDLAIFFNSLSKSRTIFLLFFFLLFRFFFILF